MDHLHDDVISLLRPDAFRVLLSCANKGFCFYCLIAEYGASAQAPLIDSVFAGRLVSIVICRQCHKVSYQVSWLLPVPNERFKNLVDSAAKLLKRASYFSL